MLEYYFSKVFAILECNANNLEKLPNEFTPQKKEETDNSDKVMTCINTITYTSNTLKNLLLNIILHSSCIQTELNEKN